MPALPSSSASLTPATSEIPTSSVSYSNTLLSSLQNRLTAHPNSPGAATTIAVWSQVEAGLAIAAGSFATLRPLYRMALVKLGLSTNTTAPTYGRGGVQYYHNSHAAAGGAESAFHKSRIGGGGGSRNVFSMATFNRMDDDDDDMMTDNDDNSQRGVVRAAAGAGGGDKNGDYTVQVVSGTKGFDAAAHPQHQRGESDHKGLQIHYSKEFGSDST